MLNQKDLQHAIEQINDYTDQNRVRELVKQIEWMNTADPTNAEIFRLARIKQLILENKLMTLQ